MSLQIIQDSEEFERKIDLKLNQLETNLISQLKQEFQPKTPEEYLSRSEVAKLLKVTTATLDRWTDQGKLKRYGLGARVFYKRSEVEESLIQLK
ncbi:DNA binding domain-containing protein, excisionase family [Salinimicrobium catena]|uniref:DNA binding domain-containing protein, excisionase family n=1 Tax=Salinimicrobium catena TaxID=390640 RepID=A0A1H5P7N0_9FLAO|nr:helix-turn-helix domain-containing protein [Salinimicrobium catena]SDL72017.1 DNA binding domain-containing protein, excisionase family [Salinimicrobium catena]SEF09027.1 DNA binding domain-containing protein, excisionase family [Salinimicrobium catena]